MKDRCAATIFRQLGVFGIRISLLAGLLAGVGAAPASASDYSASLNGCKPPTPQIFGSPTPIGVIGGDDHSGGGMFVGSPIKGEVHAAAAAPNALIGVSEDCSIHATVNFDDFIITGPAPQVTVTLHVPFHANIIQNFDELTDGTNQVFSSGAANLFFLVQVGGATARMEIRWNRQAGIKDVLITPAVFPFGSSQFVPKPRIPGLTPLDTDGFVTRFFQNSLPITGGVGLPFAGFDTYTIDEVRGEILLTTQVNTNQAFNVHLDMNGRSTASASFIASALAATNEMALSVPTDGAIVFDLPAGYTADSPSAGVINNVVPQVFKCPRTLADWRTHPAQWPVTTMILGAHSYTQPELLQVMTTPVTVFKPDASVTLAQQLIAARLNEANGAAPGPMLPPSMLADALLSGFAGKLAYHVLPSTVVGSQMMTTAAQLNNYNAGALTPPCVP